eukprot:1154799-Pelagomonas_calceolata.AAC.2
MSQGTNMQLSMFAHPSPSPARHAVLYCRARNGVIVITMHNSGSSSRIGQVGNAPYPGCVNMQLCHKRTNH